MSKTSLSSRIRIAFLNIMQAFGSAASHWASNAKLRVQEINLQSRRHEILTEASMQAFELWHSGEKLPKVLDDMFTELSEIDDKLSVLRAQKYAKVKPEQAEIDSEAELCEAPHHPDEIDAEALVCAPVADPSHPTHEENKPAAKKSDEPKPKK